MGVNLQPWLFVVVTDRAMNIETVLGVSMDGETPRQSLPWLWIPVAVGGYRMVPLLLKICKSQLPLWAMAPVGSRVGRVHMLRN